ncbi:hypothetical protein LTR10_018745 [Elasticomyces elasticus]|uniref:FAD-binding FR-type domain-containing protein n=1 Tax=Exophiala sideris TaxID=1016849 RepID=A0ABR0JB16_9EURO|nr:hypothetical protein LTR10_018745 [Elasticomyces elasticus]KAK5026218.1 hypothetical protein LTS07_007743 [Exophiala sideris]KAK5032471.1 hypothetical protein LTR13_007294 [Exophiala sideris]KAK5059630.1 hypothetical protein LTR69_006219 [Exophiala sideris]KAK5178087.1 hypothetical protein LTR44_009393 [Eurotiomycetes sp. CCFEE 6388]
MASTLNVLPARHIQNLSDATALQHHWGYADRALPCTNDAGSCAYLDSVYHSHDLGMLHSGILWATIGGILFIWAIGRLICQPSERHRVTAFEKERPKSSNQHGKQRLWNACSSFGRRYLLPDCCRSIFGRSTRLQVLILAVLTGYLTIWTFVGITYKQWITPVKGMPGVYNTRTGLGPWADRVGVLAYALTPLSVMLSSRESLLSLLTGIPYQRFNFLHRWLGYIMLVQASLHTIGWCVVEMRLYQPQPQTGLEWIAQKYMIWGVIAMFLLTVIFVLSTPWAIRRTGYEFFRKSHYIVAMLYIGCCWGHWSQLDCYMISSLVLWLVDRGIRLVRTALIHYNYLSGSTMGFRSASAAVTYFPDAKNGDVVRLDFTQPQDPWGISAHFYLCFPQVSIWQAHPFTPCSLPGDSSEGQLHSYVLRAKGGATKALADLAATKTASSTREEGCLEVNVPTTPVILAGPYGGSIMNQLQPDTNVLCVAGGTGVTFVLPVLLKMVKDTAQSDRKIELVWVVRRSGDVAWVKAELDVLRQAEASHALKIRIFVTRECSASGGDDVMRDKISLSSSTEVLKTPSASESGCITIQSPAAIEDQSESRHPDLRSLVRDFVGSTVRGPTSVFASGPGGMLSDLREAVADCNSAKKVWTGNERFNVELISDDRLEW